MRTLKYIRVKQRNIKDWGFLSRNIELTKFALSLEKNTPKSELWFYNLYQDYKSPNDKYNCPFGIYIPDIINHFFKYVIEIDGSIHDKEYIKEKDLKKDLYYKSKGYEVIRVKAFDEESFKQAMLRLSKLR